MNIKGFFWVFSLELLFCEEEFKITFLDTQKKIRRIFVGLKWDLREWIRSFMIGDKSYTAWRNRMIIKYIFPFLDIFTQVMLNVVPKLWLQLAGR